nr:hypothetical protein HmN_000428700 [Hymenolepis microstoma]CUU99043.1 hypothetical transcript [Hymenolepis microstoma]
MPRTKWSRLPEAHVKNELSQLKQLETPTPVSYGVNSPHLKEIRMNRVKCEAASFLKTTCQNVVHSLDIVFTAGLFEGPFEKRQPME